jgi:hypothetical protein
VVFLTGGGLLMHAYACISGFFSGEPVDVDIVGF